MASPPAATGPRDLEYLGRAFNSEERNISTPSAIFSLVATMVGGGVLSLPYTLARCGLIPGTLALAASAAASTWTMNMLVDCARATGCDTFELVGHAAFGEQARRVTMLLVFILCWLALVGYYVILGDLLVPILELAVPTLQGFHPQETLRRLVLCGATLVAGPMCFKTGLHSLRFLCFASVGSVFMVGVAIAVRAWPNFNTSHVVEVMLPDRDAVLARVQAGYALWPADWIEALYVFPTFGVAFLGHFNALPTHQELRRPTRWRVHRVLAVTMGVTTLLYFFLATSGYVYAGNLTCGNIFLNFTRGDPLILVGRAAFALVIMLNFPLLCQPCRNALFRLVASCRCCSPATAASEAPHEVSLQPTGGSFNGSDAPPPGVVQASPAAQVHVYRREDTRRSRDHPAGLDALDTFIPKDDTVQQSAVEATCLQRCLLTALLLGGALTLACVLQSLMVVWSILGSTVAFSVGFIMPAAFWYRLVGLHKRAASRFAAGTLLLTTVTLALVCTYLTVVNLGMPPCPVPANHWPASVTAAAPGSVL